MFAHNLETVRRLHDRIRPAFGYDRSLEVLRIAKRLRAGQVTKSNLILGMGERPDRRSPRRSRDLADAGCDIVTIGQYLQPDEHPPAGRPLGDTRRVRRAQARRARPSASRTSRPDRSSGARTTPASSSGAATLAGASPRLDRRRALGERWRSRPVSRILCAGLAAGRRPSLSALSRRGAVRRPRAAYPGARTGRPRTLPAWPCSGWGLPSRPVARPAGELLPHRFTLTRARMRAAVCSLWRFPRGRPRLGVTQHPALRSPDFPRPIPPAAARPAPPPGSIGTGTRPACPYHRPVDAPRIAYVLTLVVLAGCSPDAVGPASPDRARRS